jgi:hypothetical protein
MAAHWVNDPMHQVTIYTCVAHVCKSLEEKQTISMAVISESPHHTSIEVAVYNDVIIKFLASTYGIHTLHIWTDGASQHFKNYKTMALCSLYRQDYGLTYVDWNFQVS